MIYCARSGTRGTHRLFTPALSFDDIARDSPSPRPRLGRNSIQRPQSNLSPPSHSFLGPPSCCWFTHLLVAPSSRALRRQALRGSLSYLPVKRDSAPVAIYLLRCVTTPNGAISRRLHFILLVPCSMSAYVHADVSISQSVACVVLRSHRQSDIPLCSR
ncbi:hypothetical protein C8J57DRAFT_303946 [Mycena rebaudengoi]|nr:hypothetical protein C8J57DRAFT_303946 [Mycena rebaudengoi]